ncbi:MAG: hypothetical protein A3A33_04995 [Candidatus Yanofskybacteria bacterium RIFCSPLOWO2_01_FULL_49_25]|uniref:Uncharacterized protein n=1 Tax=Candidatus Yanofskybacteria bacterium RIFCSPLOWO2_01_FULL_49_25 TaxID=1802701 RepID=A0A1F8GQ29_9BACT|nr:MAG: hypothetical protein A3A33_04995 [Candidatus Yanofskybacteria bacterium RIFCSPLOWO2_01_FULL_49_25]
MSNRTVKILHLIAWTVPFLIVPVFHAAGAPSPSPLGISLTYVDVINILNGLVCWAMRIGVLLAVIFWVFGGIQIMAGSTLSIGKGEKKNSISAGKSTLTQVLIGLVVILLVSAILHLVANTVGSSYSIIPLVC